MQSGSKLYIRLYNWNKKEYRLIVQISCYSLLLDALFTLPFPYVPYAHSVDTSAPTGLIGMNGSSYMTVFILIRAYLTSIVPIKLYLLVPIRETPSRRMRFMYDHEYGKRIKRHTYYDIRWIEKHCLSVLTWQS